MEKKNQSVRKAENEVTKSLALAKMENRDQRKALDPDDPDYEAKVAELDKEFDELNARGEKHEKTVETRRKHIRNVTSMAWQALWKILCAVLIIAIPFLKNWLKPGDITSKE